MAVRVDDPGRPTRGQQRNARSPFRLGSQGGDQAPVQNGGFFVDRPGDNSTIEGGLGIDLGELGRIGISAGPALEIPGLPRLGLGATQTRQGRGSARQPNPGAAGAVEDMDFADYLALAQQYLSEGGSGAPDYSAIENALKQHALQSDARLQAMYNQLHGSIDADAPTIAGQYDQAQAAIGQNADQAANNVNDAYQASRDAQSQQLAALGIQDAAGVLAASGGNAAADQAHAVGNIEQNRQTGQQQTTLNKASALDYNTNIGNASLQAGGEARNGLQQQLMDALAEIALRKSQAQSDSGRSSIDLAMQLQDRDASQGPSSQDQQALAEFLYRQQNDQSNRSADLWQTLLRLYDGDTQKAAQAYAQSQASGLA